MASRRLKDDQKVVEHNDESDDDLENIVYKSSKKGGIEAPTPKPISTPAPGKNQVDGDEEENESDSSSDDENESESSNSSDEHALDGLSDDEDADAPSTAKETQSTQSAKSNTKSSTKSTSTSHKKKGDEVVEEEVAAFPQSKTKSATKSAAKSSGKKKGKRMKYADREGTDSDEDEVEEKELAEWRKYWTKKELYGRYLPTKELGRGSYGVVFEGKSTWNSNKLGITIDTKVAIKKVRRVFNTDTDAKRLLRELKILRTLRGHQSIVKLYDILPPVDPAHFKTLTIVFEYVDADLSKIFKTNQYFSLSICRTLCFIQFCPLESGWIF